MTTTEALNKIASEEGYTDFIVLMANSNIGFITDRVEKAMIIDEYNLDRELFSKFLN